MLDCDRCHRWFHGPCVGILTQEVGFDRPRYSFVVVLAASLVFAEFRINVHQKSPFLCKSASNSQIGDGGNSGGVGPLLRPVSPGGSTNHGPCAEMLTQEVEVVLVCGKWLRLVCGVNSRVYIPPLDRFTT